MHWTKTVQWDGAVLLGFERSNSSQNALNMEAIAELHAILKDMQAPLLIIYSKKSSFCVGADVTEFTSADVSSNIEAGHSCFQLLENLPFPTVAAINGNCLGGGAELALACDYRVATHNASIGLPEVRLGIHPGWGGTARLPDLIGAHQALPLLLQGKPVSGKRALSLGLVDAICDQSDLVRTSRRLVASSYKRPLIHRAIVSVSNSWLFRTVFSQVLYFQTQQRVVQSQYPSPFAIIDLWREYGTLQDRLDNETASLLALSKTPTASNLVKIFLLQESLKRGDKNHNIFHVHIVGSTELAGNLAGLCAREGLVVSTDEDLSDQAHKFIAHKLSGEKLAVAFGRIVMDPSGLERADLVMEAVPEQLSDKINAVARMQSAKSSAIIATTTGIFTLDKLQKIGHPLRLKGIHFFSPLGMVPLVEVREEARLVSFAKSLGKLPIVVQDRPLLVVNRLLAPYVFEACAMAEEGYSVRSINSICQEFGMPIGPIALLDKMGRQEWQAIADESELPTPRLILGEDLRGTRPVVNSDRLIFPLIKAAINAATNRLAAGPDLIDAAAIFGIGFAPFRGGPIQYSRERLDFDAVLSGLEAPEIE